MELEAEEELLDAVTFPGIDEIPEPIKVLDDVISEFEDISCRPLLLIHNNGENQSEDDGYMSLSRKNMKEKRNSEELSQSSSNCGNCIAGTPNNENFEMFNHNLKATTAHYPVDDDEQLLEKSTNNNNNKKNKNSNSNDNDNVSSCLHDLAQTTLPKARNIAASSNYSSLPCCGQRATSAATVCEFKNRVGGSCNSERNALGIDISAVHKAVLGGSVARLPEPILNEHPITIYPGPWSPTKDGNIGNIGKVSGGGGIGVGIGLGVGVGLGVASGRPNRSKNLLNSVEKHKEICHILNTIQSSNSHISSISSDTSASSISIETCSDNRKTQSVSSTHMHDYRDHRESLRNTSDDDALSLGGSSIEGITISSESAHYTPCGIAWDIYFKDDDRKKSKEIKRKSDKCKNNSSSCQNHHHNVARQGNSNQFAEGEYQNFEVHPEIRNSCVFRNSSMLGKGTFIIRRGSTKKSLPAAMDIFSNCTNPASSTISTTTFTIATDDTISSKDDHNNKANLNESQLKSTKSIKYLDQSKTKEEVTKQKNRHLQHQNQQQKIDKAPGVTSPRDRLSLDIEPQHHYQQRQSQQLQSLTNSKRDTSPGQQIIDNDLAIGLKKSCNLHSPELLTKTICMEQEESVIPVTTNYNFILNTNSADPSNVFMYKPVNNGSDYNDLRCSNTTTPHTDLAPTLEEDEEQLSDLSFGCAPLKQIENNISALLRGDMAMVRMSDIIMHQQQQKQQQHQQLQQQQKSVGLKRPLEFRPGVHKSESAKEMLLSQNAFGPLPPSPLSSNPQHFDYGDLPLPPSPSEAEISSDGGDNDNGNDNDNHDVKKPVSSYLRTTAAEVHSQTSKLLRDDLPPIQQQQTKDIEKPKIMHRHMSDELPLPPPPTTTSAINLDNLPPIVPPHRTMHSANTIKSWSIDSNYRRKSPRVMCYGSGVTTPTSSQGPSYDGSSCSGTAGVGGGYGTRRYISYGTKRSLKQSPREEHRLQTSCSLPETPIFARGCDIPRTPYRRTPNESTPIGSRTAPRSNTSNNITMGNSIVGISAGNTYGGGSMCRQRSINHALASNEMLRLSGAPQRGWYPKQRAMRPASTENIDRIHSMRVWDSNAAISGTGTARKPLTLPPNLTPSFLNKSPREALRRVTSLLITKKKSSKEKRHKPSYNADHALDINNSHHYQDIHHDIHNATTQKEDTKYSHQTLQNDKVKKKGIFKTLWKRTKHSFDQ